MTTLKVISVRDEFDAFLQQLRSNASLKIAGVSCPINDSNERRDLLLLSSGVRHPLQLNDIGADEQCVRDSRKKGNPTGEMRSDLATGKAAAYPEGSVVVIGPFIFDEKILALGRQELMDAAASGADWLVIDEVGPLELKKGQGFEPAVSDILARFKSGGPEPAVKNIVILVRVSLREEFLTKYGITESQLS